MGPSQRPNATSMTSPRRMDGHAARTPMSAPAPAAKASQPLARADRTLARSASSAMPPRSMPSGTSTTDEAATLIPLPRLRASAARHHREDGDRSVRLERRLEPGHVLDVPAVDEHDDGPAEPAPVEQALLEGGAVLRCEPGQELAHRRRRLRPLLLLAPGQLADVGEVLDDHGRAPFAPDFRRARAAAAALS